MSETIESIERDRGIKRCRLQALGMAAFAGIEISEQQALNYSECRMYCDRRPMLSDQRILHLKLSPDQRQIFEQKYEHISFD